MMFRFRIFKTGSADPDPDPDPEKNGPDPQHCVKGIICLLLPIIIFCLGDP